jgi:AraC family transcriptional regulator, L-rhamnose operon regulatory protein RhaS
MTVLHSVDFFPSGNASVAIEPRLPQADFPEHHHDFHEIVIVEHGTGIHVFNGQPYTITGGTVCFVRDHDRHLYEHTDNLCLTNVLYRSPDRFQFLAGSISVSRRAESVAATRAGWAVSVSLAR